MGALSVLLQTPLLLTEVFLVLDEDHGGSLGGVVRELVVEKDWTQSSSSSKTAEDRCGSSGAAAAIEAKTGEKGIGQKNDRATVCRLSPHTVEVVRTRCEEDVGGRESAAASFV
jgi:hypothetical protein